MVGTSNTRLVWSEDKKIFVALNEDEAKNNARKYYNKDVDLNSRDPDVLRYLVFIWFVAFCNIRVA